MVPENRKEGRQPRRTQDTGQNAGRVILRTLHQHQDQNQGEHADEGAEPRAQYNRNGIGHTQEGMHGMPLRTCGLTVTVITSAHNMPQSLVRPCLIRCLRV